MVSLSREDIDKFIELFPGDFAVYVLRGTALDTLCFSRGIPALSGMTEAEYGEAIGRDASAVVFEQDRGLVASNLANLLSTGGDVDLLYRIVHKTLGSVWVHARARLVGELEGAPVVVSAFMATSTETEVHEQLLDGVSEAVHVFDASSGELLYANAPMLETWGKPSDACYQGQRCAEFTSGCGGACPWCDDGSFAPEADVLPEVHDERLGRAFRYSRRRVSWHGRDAVAVFAGDITETCRARQALEAENSRLEEIIEHIPTGVCVFSVKDGTPTLVAANRYLREVIQTTSGSLGDFANEPLIERVHPDDRAAALAVSRGFIAGEGHGSCEFRLRDEDSERYRWLSLDGTTMDMPDGSFLVFSCIHDISSRKDEEQRYRRSIDELVAANPRALCGFVLNLTTNGCEEARGTSSFLQETLRSNTVDGVFENFLKLVDEPESLAQCRAFFDRRALVSAFASGRDRLSIVYRRRDGLGRRIWVRSYLSMLRNPMTGDIEAVIYSEDVDDQRRHEAAIQIAAESGYDYIALVDVSRRVISFQYLGQPLPENYREDVAKGAVPEGYDEARSYMVGSWVMPEDRDSFLASTSLEAIRAALEAEGRYEVGIRAMRGDAPLRKLLQFAYLDNSHQTIVVWQTDITESFAREQEAQDRLQVALAAANQASNAKSVFLSRMSHEIRTPMNAIIGMDALAARAIGDDQRVADCISKIGISSRYLLSLINDILDMSRIESGKMLLKNEKFLLKDLITAVNDIIYGQADAKGLDYECTVAPELDDAYLGDAMKLQQVLVNILGNAVKFTEHGRVTLAVELVNRTGDQAKVRFVVNDTGQGIREDDLEKIFEPFEQADASTTSPFGGTGLGLAITKSLVELMGGMVRVRSILGVGSEFTVYVPLTIDEVIAQRRRNISRFDRMSCLVVDDDLVVCEQAKQVLGEIGMVGEWVTSGYEAVDRVQACKSQDGHYDFILVDWKMPGIDGVETTRQIRRIVGPDVTIIIISAYDWESIEADAKAAGANLLVTKPLFKATLVSAFERATGGAEEISPATPDWDFTGHRVLVAEDNAINAEIARDLLENRHFTVELAVNGLEALQMFTQNPAGYYDAILMDVRMPQMDGLQTASNIRHLRKADAKMIPIIAMTANAFDEDVEKSHAAGMDAHLAKPIEPDVMFRTLRNLIDERDADSTTK